MLEHPEDFVNGPAYAAALFSRFKLLASIDDLLLADSLMKKSDSANRLTNASLCKTLSYFNMQRHRFPEADAYLQRAITLEGLNAENANLLFDISFDRGEYAKAKSLLSSIAMEKSYHSFFRKSKFEHYSGETDSAIASMQSALNKAGENKLLKQAALDNLADLYLHKGNAEQAYLFYQKSLTLDAADMHSICGIANIALLNDQNTAFADSVFSGLRTKSKNPDLLLKSIAVAEEREDTVTQLNLALEFSRQTDNPVFGLMYSKYLISLYTGILHEPAKAVLLAEKEIQNRSTPQIYAWYAWSLYCNGEKEKATKVFKTYVSGKPLEALELYEMGKLLHGCSRGYDAQNYFEAAGANALDLSPQKIRDLKQQSE